MLKVLSSIEDQGGNYTKGKVASTYFSNSIVVDDLSFRKKGWGEFKYIFHCTKWIYEIILKIQTYNFEHIVGLHLGTLFHNKWINWWKLSHFKILRWKNLSLVSVAIVDYFLFLYAQTLDNLHFFWRKGGSLKGQFTRHLQLKIFCLYWRIEILMKIKLFE
jgi:hypothetical protein